jgi:hypothetical protein
MGTIGMPEILLLVLCGIVLYVVSLVWAYRDAERRGQNGILVVLLVALVAWPLGLIVWLIIRR